MLFQEYKHGVLAISQLTHAWISGQILAAWADELDRSLLLAAEQHDIGWLDWEAHPTFDPAAGRPHLFRSIGAAVHAPMWAAGVERALGAWGTRVALLISRHGGVIYQRFTERHRLTEADALAARHYLSTQAPVEAGWARSLGLDAAALERDTALIAFADTLSLVLCGELKAPLEIEVPILGRGMQTLRVAGLAGQENCYSLSPWPFRGRKLTVEGEARWLPGGSLEDETAMRVWLSGAERVPFNASLAPLD